MFAAASLAASIAGVLAAFTPGSLAGAATALASSAGPRCVPSQLNASDVVPGTSLDVSPLPGSYDATPATQISMVGAPVSALSHIRVSGSRTGSHAGVLRAYSQGDGASFVPAKPFRAGEAVTVAGSVAHRRFSYRFTVAQQDVIPYVLYPHPNRDPDEKQHFHSRRDIEPPLVVVSARSPAAAPGDIFATPYSGPGPSGAMILDEAGNLVWFDPLPAGTEATNLQVQELEGAPVLSWWQGLIPVQGFGEGEEVIANRELPRDRPRTCRQRPPRRPARLPHLPPEHDGRPDRVRPRRL